MIDWVQLVKERDEWVAKNFPPAEGEVPGNDSILGCIEELGELAHAHLKAKQGIRGTQKEHDAAMQDAIGDLIVYLLGVISAHVDPAKVGFPRNAQTTQGSEPAIFMLAGEVGELAYNAQDPPEIGASWLLYINNIIKLCEEFCEGRYWNLEKIVMDTWAHVKQRDWNAHREAGAAKDDPAVDDPRPQSILDLQDLPLDPS